MFNYKPLLTITIHWENIWKSKFSTKKSLVILVNYPLSSNITINITIHHPVRPVRLRLRHKGGLVGPERDRPPGHGVDLTSIQKYIYSMYLYVYIYIIYVIYYIIN
jgi:hypothetical protein